MLANMSADATHGFQPFQPSSKLVEKVDQPTNRKRFFPIEHEKKKKPNQLNQPKTVDPNRTRPKNYIDSSPFIRLLEGSIDHAFLFVI